MNARARVLYERGMREVETETVNYSGAELARIIAAMLDAALPEKKERKPSGAAFTRGQDIHKYLAAQCSGQMQMEPCTQASIVVAGKQALAANLTGPDIQALAEWIRGGGLDWMRGKPTWLQCSRKLVDWVAQAKAEPPLPGVLEEQDDALGRLRGRREL